MELDPNKLDSLTVKVLQTHLEKRKLDTKGKKDQLVARLKEALLKESSGSSNTESKKASQPETQASTSSTQEEREDDEVDIEGTEENEAKQELDTNGNAPKESSENTLNEEEKRKKRAERFGIPDEEEKRKKRGERFGIPDEDEKKKKRSERFGIVSEEDKLKKRAERFGTQVSPTNSQDAQPRFNVTFNNYQRNAKRKNEEISSSVNVLSPEELEKRKVRAMRFSASTNPLEKKQKT